MPGMKMSHCVALFFCGEVILSAYIILEGGKTGRKWDEAFGLTILILSNGFRDADGRIPDTTFSIKWLSGSWWKNSRHMIFFKMILGMLMEEPQALHFLQSASRDADGRIRGFAHSLNYSL